VAQLEKRSGQTMMVLLVFSSETVENLALAQAPPSHNIFRASFFSFCALLYNNDFILS